MRVRRTIPLAVVAIAASAALTAACVPPTPPDPGDPATTAGTPAPSETVAPGVATTAAPADTTTTAAPTTAATTTTTIADPSRHGSTPMTGFWRVDAASGTKIVYASVIQDGVLYLGGNFDRLISPDGSQSINQANLAAIKLGDGTPVTGFPQANGVVEALAVANGRLYVGGEFTSLGGQSRGKLGAVDLGSNAVSAANLTPTAGGKVFALDATSSHLFVGGGFSTIGGTSIARLAKVRLQDGVVETGFNAAITGGVVRGIDVASTGIVYVGGQFTSVGGDDSRDYLASLSETTGAWSGPTWRFNFGGNIDSAGFQDVAASPDGTRVFAGAMGKWNSAVAWYATGTKAGQMIWQCRTKGNIQAIAISNGDLYFGFHEGYEVYDGPILGFDGNIEIQDGRIKVLRVGVNSTGACPVEKTLVPYTDPVYGTVTASYPIWAPKIDNQVWSITSNGNLLVVTGDFTKVWDTDPIIMKDATRHAGFVVFD